MYMCYLVYNIRWSIKKKLELFAVWLGSDVIDRVVCDAYRSAKILVIELPLLGFITNDHCRSEIIAQNSGTI